MENNYNKKSAGKLWRILFFVLVILVAGAALALYQNRASLLDKMGYMQKQSVQPLPPKWQDVDMTAKNEQGFMVATELGDYYVTKNGSVYFAPADLSKKAGEQSGLKDKNWDFAKDNTPGEIANYSLQLDDFNLKYSGAEEQDFNIKAYKLNLKRIHSLYKVKLGQQNGDDSDHLVAIDQSGKATLIYVSPGGSADHQKAIFKMKEIKGKKIVGVLSVDVGEALGALLVEKDGHRSELSLEDF